MACPARVVATAAGSVQDLSRNDGPAPLVLLAHGRDGGMIPPELQQLAAELRDRRRAPVLVQVLTAAAPDPDPDFWQAAQRAGAVVLVPLLLLPGGHVRRDLPEIAAAWRQRPEMLGLRLRRLPFLGAWPRWQSLLAAELRRASARGGAEVVWLHHPLEGPLASRFLSYQTIVFGCRGLAAPYTAEPGRISSDLPSPAVLVPLTLAANRLTDRLLASPAVFATAGAAPASGCFALVPPLLDLAALRQFLLSALEVLP
jgi:sirohydrochlorin ferrochelatase